MNIFGIKASRSVATANTAVVTAEPKPEEAIMSLATELQKVEQETVKGFRTFVGWAIKEEQKITGEAPAVIAVADKTLSWARLVLPSVLLAEGNAPGAALAAGAVNVAQNIVDEASRDLTAIQGAVFDAGPNPSIMSSIASVRKNLSTLVSDSHVKSEKGISLVNKIVDGLGELVQVFTPVLGALAPAAG